MGGTGALGGGLCTSQNRGSCMQVYRRFAPVGGDTVPARLRALERLVPEAAAPLLGDPLVQEHAEAYHLIKRVGAKGGGGSEVAGLDLLILAPADAGDPIRAASERHLGNGWEKEATTESQEFLAHPVARDYRIGLRDITDIALELHPAEPALLREHQCFLIDLACRGRDPRHELHPYLCEHSPTYLSRSGASGREGASLWGWEHEEFWTRLFTPGPAMELLAPLASLWNIVVGERIRRGSERSGVLRTLGIECPGDR